MAPRTSAPRLGAGGDHRLTGLLSGVRSISRKAKTRLVQTEPAVTSGIRHPRTIGGDGGLHAVTRMHVNAHAAHVVTEDLHSPAVETDLLLPGVRVVKIKNWLLHWHSLARAGGRRRAV